MCHLLLVETALPVDVGHPSAPDSQRAFDCRVHYGSRCCHHHLAGGVSDAGYAGKPAGLGHRLGGAPAQPRPAEDTSPRGPTPTVCAQVAPRGLAAGDAGASLPAPPVEEFSQLPVRRNELEAIG